MLTKFGKELRKIRIENDEILKDMADKLNVTAAYLSAVEMVIERCLMHGLIPLSQNIIYQMKKQLHCKN